MRSVLLVGANSFIGKSFKRWIRDNSISDIKLESLSLRDDTWKSFDLSKYDSVIHLAAIVHSPKAEPSLYYEVNRDLTTAFAIKAKQDGVKHFIFVSTLSVYGNRNSNFIDQKTVPKPNNHYGISKLEAENNILKLQDENFIVSIIRPPLVYGPHSPGNFAKIMEISKFSFVVPFVSNKRSMIFIDNLSNFLFIILKNRSSGIFIPQNSEYVCTSEILLNSRKIAGKKTFILPIVLPQKVKKSINIIDKIFGNLLVDQQMSSVNEDYNKVTFKESIKLSMTQQ